MRFERKKEEEPVLGITPLIDIVFLLLIFLMLTSHFHVASGIPIRLPKVTQEAVEEKMKKMILAIDREGQVYFQGERTGLSELSTTLRKLVDRGEPVQLVLQADRDVKHGRVVEIMDLAKRGGVSSIIIAARWVPQKGY